VYLRSKLEFVCTLLAIIYPTAIITSNNSKTKVSYVSLPLFDIFPPFNVTKSARIRNPEKGTIGSKKITNSQSAKVPRTTRKLAMAKRAKDQVADCQVQFQLKFKFGFQVHRLTDSGSTPELLSYPFAVSD